MLGGEVPLTGEAAGRQMWYYDGKMAQALARVGKKNAEYSFSAAVNPNRYLSYLWAPWTVHTLKYI